MFDPGGPPTDRTRNRSLFHNGRHETREGLVFLVNAIPVLMIECKNASKNEAIALGVDQTRRYHRETHELFVSQQVFAEGSARS